MCWVALDRALRLAVRGSRPAPVDRWRRVRDEIYWSVFEEFWNEDLKAFVQTPGSSAVDASTLLMPLVRFISDSDPRWCSTLDAIRDQLVEDSMVYRYRPGHDAVDDGLGSEEGTFLLCTFWYVNCLARAGRIDEARLCFEKVLAHANHVGLYAEQLGRFGEQLGNFPQALTHLGLISAAYSLNGRLESAESKHLWEERSDDRTW
jgi:GH15 family glucan-1,4-alpha-glucosidase